jgi:hypothetical protein
MLPDAVKTERGPEEADAHPTPRPVRRGLPPWQMLVALALVLVAIVGLCQVTGLARRLRPLPAPTPVPTATLVPTAMAVATPTSIPTDTPVPTPTATPVPVIMPGGQVIVRGTEGQQLSLRALPAVTQARLRILDEGTVLKVLEGPEAADGFQWWKVQTSDGVEGWVAGNWLVPLAP